MTRFFKQRKIKATGAPLHSKSGVALIVVMWVLVIVSLIVSSFAFEMQMEAKIISVQRSRFQADQLALAGIELAKAMLLHEEDAFADEELIHEDPLLAAAVKIVDGIPVTIEEELGNGTIRVKIDFEKGRRNISKLTNEQWTELFIQTGVPSSEHDELLGCLKDWEDEGDLHELNGAEKDDSFYREKGYEPKNAPIDTIDELMLIKGWTKEIVYGTDPKDLEDTDEPMSGVARHLTTWGDGKVNPNSASREVLSSLYIDEFLIEEILEARLGLDGEAGTADDGITQKDLAALGLDSSLFSVKPEYVTVEAEGKVGEVTSQIFAVFKLGGEAPTPLFWNEGKRRDPANPKPVAELD